MRLTLKNQPLDGIKASALLKGAKPDKVHQFYAPFRFAFVDVYEGTWSEIQDFLLEQRIIITTKGLLLSPTASLHYIKKGNAYVGYVADTLGKSVLLIESEDYLVKEL